MRFETKFTLFVFLAIQISFVGCDPTMEAVELTAPPVSPSPITDDNAFVVTDAYLFELATEQNVSMEYVRLNLSEVTSDAVAVVLSASLNIAVLDVSHRTVYSTSRWSHKVGTLFAQNATIQTRCDTLYEAPSPVRFTVIDKMKISGEVSIYGIYLVSKGSFLILPYSTLRIHPRIQSTCLTSAGALFPQDPRPLNVSCEIENCGEMNISQGSTIVDTHMTTQQRISLINKGAIFVTTLNEAVEEENGSEVAFERGSLTEFAVANESTPVEIRQNEAICNVHYTNTTLASGEVQLHWDVGVNANRVVVLSLFLMNHRGSSFIVEKGRTAVVLGFYTDGTARELFYVAPPTDIALPPTSIKMTSAALHLRWGALQAASLSLAGLSTLMVQDSDEMVLSGNVTANLDTSTFAVCNSVVAVKAATVDINASGGHLSRFILGKSSDIYFTESKLTFGENIRTELLNGKLLSDEVTTGGTSTATEVVFDGPVAWRVDNVTVHQQDRAKAPSSRLETGNGSSSVDHDPGLSPTRRGAGTPLTITLSGDSALVGSNTYPLSERGVTPRSFVQLIFKNKGQTKALLHDTQRTEDGACTTALHIFFPISVKVGQLELSGCTYFPNGGTWQDPAGVSGNGTLLLGGSHVVQREEGLGELLFSRVAVVLTAASSLAFSGRVDYLFAKDLALDAQATLSVQGNHTTRIMGTLNATEGSTIQISGTDSSESTPVLEVDTAVLGGDIEAELELTSCTNLLLVNNDFLNEGNVLRLTCTSPVYPERSGQYIPLVSWSGKSQRDEPSIEQHGCSGAGVSVEPVIRDKKLLLQLNVRRTSERTMVTVTAFVICAISFFSILLCFRGQVQGLGCVRAFTTSLAEQPPIRLRLRWDEARQFLPNMVVAFVMIVESIWLFCVAFHPTAQWNSSVRNFQLYTQKVMFFMDLKGKSFYTLYALCVILVYVWVLLWLPLWCATDESKPRNRFRLKSLLASLENLQKTRMARFYHVHRTMCALCNFFYIPLLLVLSHPFSCRRDPKSNVLVMLADDNVTCWGTAHDTLMFFSCTATLLLAFLCFHSGSNLTTPFGHPPYRHDLDIRYKRVFEATRIVLLQMQVLCLAVFHTDMMALLALSLAIQMTYLAVAAASSPSIFYNVNRHRVLFQSMGVWAVFLSFAVGLEMGANEMPCRDQPGWLSAILFLGLIFCVVVHQLIRRHTDKDTALPEDAEEGTDLASRTAFRQASLKKLKTDIGGLRRRQYTSDGDAEAGEKPDLLRLRLLQIQWLKELDGFRALKETYAMPYYLGTKEGAYFDKICAPAAEEDLGVHGTEMRGVQDEDHGEAAEADTIFEGWVRGQLLGRGSFGSVYTGVLRGGQLVAVKVIDLQVNSDDVKQEILAVKREVDFLKKLRHPNVIEYKAFFMDERNHAINIFMEYAVGGSLTSLVKKCSERLSEDVVKLYVAQILQGLEFLHSKGVIHRDIKGENVLLDANGRVKLADFGCAKEASSKTKAAGTCVGSPYWMAPEVIKNNGYNAKADIWSVGCTTVEAINGYVATTLSYSNQLISNPTEASHHGGNSTPSSWRCTTSAIRMSHLTTFPMIFRGPSAPFCRCALKETLTNVPALRYVAHNFFSNLHFHTQNPTDTVAARMDEGSCVRLWAKLCPDR